MQMSCRFDKQVHCKSCLRANVAVCVCVCVFAQTIDTLFYFEFSREGKKNLGPRSIDLFSQATHAVDFSLFLTHSLCLSRSLSLSASVHFHCSRPQYSSAKPKLLSQLLIKFNVDSFFPLAFHFSVSIFHVQFDVTVSNYHSL